MQKKGKKGQAAMEFLMTYGWAIMAAVIAIGVLAYFGVFSPGKYTSGTAIVTTPFYANAWNVQESTGINLELKNNGGETYTVSDVTITNAAVGGALSTCLPTGSLGTIDAGSVMTATILCGVALGGADADLTEGENFKGDITITYTKGGGSTVAITSTGTIAEKITA